MSRIPNNDFASLDFCFRLACDNAGLPASARQAGKYRTGRGAAFGARPTVTDLAELTVPKLREAAAQSGIEVKSKMRKADIIALMRGE